MTRVLLVGPPRSGTTWIGQALRRSEATRYVHEPDGDHEPFALRARIGHDFHIALAPGAEAPAYEALWRAAFAGGRRSRAPQARLARRWFEAAKVRDQRAVRRDEGGPWRLRAALALSRPLRPESSEHVVVKSVHACCAVEWVADRFGPQVVVVERNPLNVLSSWKEFGHGANPQIAAELAAYARTRWDLDLPGDSASRFTRQVTSLGVLFGALHESAARHPEWTVVQHEDLCVDPVTKFAALATKLGLQSTPATVAYLRESNREGEGYVTNRITSELPSKWRRTLTDAEGDEAAALLARFPRSLGVSPSVHGWGT